EPGEGIPRLLRPGPLDATSSTWENLIVIQWGGIADHLHLAVVNLSENPAGGIVRLNLNETRWNVQCLYSSHRPGSRIASEPEGLRLEFQPCEVQHLRMESSEINASRALSPRAPSKSIRKRNQS
ncbi:MAG TPA: hypothetical protein VHH88_11665, partial [Verrucomicrobiae bacterium]|nr:hypothetical protein [Verrucomicrobiae bacterium]